MSTALGPGDRGDLDARGGGGLRRGGSRVGDRGHAGVAEHQQVGRRGRARRARRPSRRSLCSCSAMSRGRFSMPSPASSRCVDAGVLGGDRPSRCSSASTSRAEASPRLPIGVAARMIMPSIVSHAGAAWRWARLVVAISLGAWVLRADAAGARASRAERTRRGRHPADPSTTTIAATTHSPTDRSSRVASRAAPRLDDWWGSRALHAAPPRALVLGRPGPRHAPRGGAAVLEPRPPAGARLRRDVLRQGRLDAAEQRLRVGAGPTAPTRTSTPATPTSSSTTRRTSCTRRSASG